jgi:hypothetical protein
MLKFIRVFLLPLVAAGCSSTPDVNYHYYFAKSQAALAAAQTVTCDASKTNVIVVTTASAPTMTYYADIARGPQTINLRDIEGDFRTFVDSDAQFGFYDDGRLKSINQYTIGQGANVIKSAVSLATTALPLAGAKVEAVTESDACAVIDKWGGGAAGKIASVNLSYAAQIDPTHVLGKSFEIPIANASQQLYKELKAKTTLPAIEASVGMARAIEGRATYSRLVGYSQDEIVPLRLQRTADVEIKVLSAHRPVWMGTVIVPMPREYGENVLPIPRAALFGKQSFSLTLSEAGAIQTIDYGKLSGASDALSAATYVAGSGPQITSNEVADVKAKADLIAQTQRLTRCQTNPANCN